MSKIKKTMPRDQSQTNEYYAFQHGETAISCLSMLKEGNFNHVFCEWHDDYVEIRSASENEEYTFCQVKGKKLSEARFSFSNLFGIKFNSKVLKKEKVYEINTDAILYKQFLIYIEFKEESKKFKVLTNFEFGENVGEFLIHIKSRGVNAIYDFNFNTIYQSYKKSLGEVFEREDLINFFSMVELVPNCNLLSDFRSKLYFDISTYLDLIREVSFTPRNIHRMIDSLLSSIEKKSKNRLTNIPDCDVEILERKAIRLTDLLEYIGVSRDIFIKLEGPDVEDRLMKIRASSRLERLFKGYDKNLIQDFLRWKTDWDIWINLNKPTMRPNQQIAIREIFSAQITNDISELKLLDALEVIMVKFKEEGIMFHDDEKQNQSIALGGLLATIIEFEAPLND